jgi:cytoskeletal protein CcmA (bactofilin family)
MTMALWKDQYGKDQGAEKESAKEKEVERPAATVTTFEPNRQATQVTRGAATAVGAEAKESVLSAGLSIEGKIEGTGHIRIAGNFKGDVRVQGNLTIEAGARVTGGVSANTVVIGGELEGNIDAASRVEILQTGVLNGDLKAGSLTVAAGSRMNGRVEFGWDDKLKAAVGS